MICPLEDLVMDFQELTGQSQRILTMNNEYKLVSTNLTNIHTKQFHSLNQLHQMDIWLLHIRLKQFQETIYH